MIILRIIHKRITADLAVITERKKIIIVFFDFEIKYHRILLTTLKQVKKVVIALI